MNPRQLSARLERVAAQVPAGARLADIGTDHGYLLVALVKRGVISAAVAGEVALTPLRAVERSVRENDLGEQIAVRLADGLAAIEPGDGITAISFCGMGGETIRDILARDKGRLGGNELLILQPNGGEQPLRRWLMDNGYRIRHEEVLQENRFFYEIIVAEPGEPRRHTDRALYFGPLLVQERSPVFVAKWRRLLRLKQQTLAGLARAQRIVQDEELEQQVRWISEMLASDGCAQA
ncbi:tRNA (adenine(22)-N(1))-methyltransferase TrmK [Pseudomonas sp. D2-3]